MCFFTTMAAFAAGYVFSVWDKKHGARVGLRAGQAIKKLFKL
jgi:hypothetical protein